VQFLSFIDAFEQTVSSIADLSEIVFMGDFNLDPVNSAGNFRLFGESVGSFNLSLVESGPTRITATSSTTSDRFIVSDLVRVRELSIVPVSSIADHELVILDLDYLRTVEKPIVKYFRDFCRTNLPALKAELSQVDINSKVESFNSVMTDVLDCYAHLKMGTYYESSIASGDVELRLLIERRELAYSLWRFMLGRRRGDGN
jgi:hypothetical protein